MKQLLLLPILLTSSALLCFSQPANSPSADGATADYSVLANLPTVCNNGQFWIVSNATSGQNWYLCIGNAWVQQTVSTATNVTSAASLPNNAIITGSGGGQGVVGNSSSGTLSSGAMVLGSNTVVGGSMQLAGATSGSFTLSVATTGSVGKLGAGVTVTSTNGIIQNTGGVPTLTGTCTTGTVTGGAVAGSFSVTATGCTAGTIIFTFSTAATHNWICNLLDFTTNTDVFKMTATSASACTMTGTAVNADVMYFNATPF
jgi:hypothetical protein